jgi:hypothetical protein
MKNSNTSLIIGLGLVGAWALVTQSQGALVASSQPAGPPNAPVAPSVHVHEEPITDLPQGHPPVVDQQHVHDHLGEGEAAPETLPLGHPSVEGMQPALGMPEVSEGLWWTAPSAWKKVENPNSMRLETYRITGTKAGANQAEDAELAISQVGGSVGANEARWMTQFEIGPKSEVKRTLQNIAGLKVRYVDIHGTYTGSMVPGDKAKENWALLGAIVELPERPAWFFKLIGPKSTVDQAKPAFDAFLKTLRQVR